jgi:hypothetical protein
MANEVFTSLHLRQRQRIKRLGLEVLSKSIDVMLRKDSCRTGERPGHLCAKPLQSVGAWLRVHDRSASIARFQKLLDTEMEEAGGREV